MSSRKSMMGKSFRRVFLGFLFFFLFSACAFTFFQKEADEPPYFEDFERFHSNADLQKVFQVWDEGARIVVSLHTGSSSAEGKSMLVNVVAPNQQSQANNGSFYTALDAGVRNWTGGTGLRFWIKNASQDPLLLSLNFKESFNEYWAVAWQGIFFLENEGGEWLKQEIAYGNLPIPSRYSGYVVLPFFSCEVPEWNTALGDQILQLEAIESLAFGVTIAQDVPRSFYMDDIAVIRQPEYPYLEIKGAESVRIPASGEHSEPYHAYLTDAQSGSSQPADAEWSLQGDSDMLPLLDEDGWLTIPAILPDMTVSLQARAAGAQGMLVAEQAVRLWSDESEPLAPPPVATQPGMLIATPLPDAYEVFSAAFENWALNNRPVFVMLAVGLVLLIVAMLSSFQKRMK